LFPYHSARHQFTLPDHGYRASASRGVPVYTSAFTHYTYPRTNGQTELAWADGYIQKWFTHLLMVTHPSTNRAQSWARPMR